MRNNTSILVLLALALCGSDAAAQGTVAKTHSGACITEVLADNRTGLRDADGLASDWIELFNSSHESVQMAGYQLKCAQGAVFTFPAIELPPHEYLLVFASGKNRASPGRALHTPFRLSRRGETLQLLAKDGALVSELKFGSQQPDVSCGREQDDQLEELLPYAAIGEMFVPQ